MIFMQIIMTSDFFAVNFLNLQYFYRAVNFIWELNSNALYTYPKMPRSLQFYFFVVTATMQY